MHKPVLLQEAINFLAPKMGGAYIDATVGAGGHSVEILKKIGKSGKLLAIDKDQAALAIAKKSLIGENVTFAHGDFCEIENIAKKNGFYSGAVDGIILDLGVSSMQFDFPERGFSFKGKSKLDMRMDQTQELTAEKVVNEYSEEGLTGIFKNYGEETSSRKIAQEIVKTRKQSPIIWTDQLAEVVRRVKYKSQKSKIKNQNDRRIDPATKVFQALRIEVNGELTSLQSALPQSVSLLKSPYEKSGPVHSVVRSRANEGGRMAVISFHSLEDRIVKQFIEKEVKNCVCPPEFPKCVCGHKPTLKKITKKPVTPSENEVRENQRSRSAKLRVAERI